MNLHQEELSVEITQMNAETCWQERGPHQDPYSIFNNVRIESKKEK